jgi:hypothetical protein
LKSKLQGGCLGLRAGQIQSIVQEARRSGTEIPIGGLLDRNGTGRRSKAVARPIPFGSLTLFFQKNAFFIELTAGKRGDCLG